MPVTRTSSANRSSASGALTNPERELPSGYLNQMRWYSRLIGWSSSATSAPSNSRLMIAVDVSTEVPKTASSMTTWSTAPTTATA